MAQAAQSGGCPLPGNIQGGGWGSEQLDPVEDVPSHDRGLGLEVL